MISNTIISLITPQRALRKIAENLRERRLSLKLTQKALSERSGMALPTLRKFEQKGVISLESLLKLLEVLGGMEELVAATQQKPSNFATIEQVINAEKHSSPKRGRRT